MSVVVLHQYTTSFNLWSMTINISKLMINQLSTRHKKNNIRNEPLREDEMKRSNTQINLLILQTLKTTAGTNKY